MCGLVGLWITLDHSFLFDVAESRVPISWTKSFQFSPSNVFNFNAIFNNFFINFIQDNEGDYYGVRHKLRRPFSFFFLFLISLFFILPLLGKYLTKTCLKLASSNILYDG